MRDQTVSLDRIELYWLDLPQKNVFRSGIGLRKSKETLLVKWIDQDGRVGYGECSCRPDPYYSAEFLAASTVLIERFVVPHLKPKQSSSDVLSILQKIRGWNFTKAAIEAAMFQVVVAGDNALPLSYLIHAKPITQVPVGISLGIYEDVQQLRDVVQEAIETGYRRLKFKISPTVNQALFDEISSDLMDSGLEISFDANGSFYAADLDRLGYFVKTFGGVIEQPTPPSRFEVLLRAKEMFPEMKVCFDEEVKNMGDLVKLHQLKVLDQLNLKLGRVGGLSHSIEILNYCQAAGIPCWIGGMFETGIGRLQNLALASFLPSATAHDLSPSSRYFQEDIVDPPIQMDQGYIDVAKARQSQPVQEIIDRYTIQKNVFKA
jgi:O-succinylbenzoate synthase